MVFFLICTAVVLAGLVACGFQLAAVRATLRSGTRDEGRGSPSAGAGSPAPGSCILNHSTPLPPISILKPLSGIDDNLFDNLASFCEQEYPAYEVLFCLQDANDPAYKVAKKVQAKYPDRDITIVAERCTAGLNPKVNNLLPGYRRSKYDTVLISDSNVLVDAGYLRAITSNLADPEVGLVSNLVRGIGGRTLGSILENLHLNSFILGSVCFLHRFWDTPCVIGKSMLMRKRDLDAIGGLAAYKDVLAEDFVIGREMDRAGRKVALSNYLVKNVNEFWGIKRFLNRHTRWGKLRWNIGGHQYLSELLANPVFIASLPALLWRATSATLGLFLVVCVLKALGDYLIGRSLDRQDRTSESARLPVRHYLLAPLKDLLIGALWIVPILSSTVVWRGNRYRIGKDSRLSPCAETRTWSWPGRIVNGIRTVFA
jgi:ceramide glucosyltransferase